MLDGKLIYYAILVFVLLMVGLVLTILEYKKLVDDEQSSKGQLRDGSLKSIKN